uniref:ubiquitinyl hydrolase 1 n=1 Tax=Ditylenchus dipsaci TaxID=166011 RepID=A0A915CVH0_9BILA
MNAALQALSNCPPLREYFRTIPLSSKEDYRNSSDSGYASLPTVNTTKPVTNVFSDLLKRLWCESQTHSYVVPTGLLWYVFVENSRFLNRYNQQDSQEFIRCLLDLLHQELRRPIRKWKTISCQKLTHYLLPQMKLPLQCLPHMLLLGKILTTISSKQLIAALVQMREITNQDCKKTSGDENLKIVGYRSIITDVFDGELVSSVKCQTCQHISSTRENFQDISLSIPTVEQLELMRDAVELEQSDRDDSKETTTLRDSAHVSDENTENAASLSYLSWIFSLASRWFLQPLSNFISYYYRYMFTGSISLENCLKAFFSADLLHGEDMYSCERCRKLRNGVKQCELVKLPEILCIHLKRFRHDNTYSGKVNTKVTFPLYDLDVRLFVKDANMLKDDQLATEYDLVAIVSHRGGGLDYGHYIAYCRNDLDMNWYEYDDSIVTRVNALERTKSHLDKVKMDGSELIQASLRGELEQEAAQLTTMNSLPSWKLGAIAVRQYTWLCSNFQYCLGVSPWKLGGGPECRGDLTDCGVCKQDIASLIQRKINEFKDLQKRIRKQMEDIPLQIDAEPPPPINNEALVRRSKDGTTRLRIGCKCQKITREAWLFLHQIYGGGPEVFSVPLNQPTTQEVTEMVLKAENALQAYYESKSLTRSEDVQSGAPPSPIQKPLDIPISQLEMLEAAVKEEMDSEV